MRARAICPCAPGYEQSRRRDPASRLATGAVARAAIRTLAVSSNSIGSGIAKAFSNPPQHIREDFGTTRLDNNLSGKDLLFAVYTIDDSSANTPSRIRSAA